MRRFQQLRDWSPGYINVCPQHVEIMAECTACGTVKEFDRRMLPASLQHALIKEIEMRLKCVCGAKAARLMFGHMVDGDAQ
ncbi:hypothetical protein [Rhizobium leguminosarum]|uniref:hypothetical protein n=1 Tax=Rhizobium leguminosarum TaxID=384 RepID=UPI0013C1EE6A|nr:hypothetical protein [Rhizobium leguminosarum]NEJ46625.1 hypothetical protein [Rhizobium leguminosarum]NEJ53730.1 hypothetical protein [Rhizobium leguminosarum]